MDSSKHVYSDNFIVQPNWQIKCSEALLLDPDPSNIPDFGGKIDWAVPGGVTSTTHFEEFKNNICPDWCPY